VQNGEIREIRVDSIGFTKCQVGFRGSADSKEFSAWRTARIGLRLERVSLAANMKNCNTDVIACQ